MKLKREIKGSRTSEAFAVSLILMAVIAFSSCKDEHIERRSSFTIKDDAGVEVEFDSPSSRIISLAPNITETLFAIGADSLVVGVTDLCDYPPEAKNKSRTGSYLSPDYEKIVSLKPDLILINVESTSNPIYQSLKNMGMKLYVSNADNFKEIISMIRNFGIITAKEASADSLIRKLNTTESELTRSADTSSLEAFVVISINPLMTANGKTFIGEILQLAGIQNIYGSVEMEYPEISYEDVSRKNPRYILFPTDTSDAERFNKFIEEIKRQLTNTAAVKENRIILIDDDIMFRPGPRIIEAALKVREKFGR